MRWPCWLIVTMLAPTAAVPGELRVEHPPNGCSLDGFTPSNGYLIHDLAEVFRVRSVKGVAASAGGEWPDDVTVLLELRGSDPGRPIRSTRTDAHGRFAFPPVPAGTYCFSATVHGWQWVIGKIEVTKNAPRGASIRFVMPLDV